MKVELLKTLKFNPQKSTVIITYEILEQTDRFIGEYINFNYSFVVERQLE